MIGLKIFMRQAKGWFWRKTAFLLPKSLVMWATIRLIAHATQGEYGNTIVPELTAMEALGRWETA